MVGGMHVHFLGSRLARVLGPAGTVAALKLVEYAGLGLFLLVVPRLMGPDRYGRFASLVSLIGLLTIASGLGAQATFGRFVPTYRGNVDKARGLFMRVFWMRGLVAAVLSVALMLLVPRTLPGTSTLTCVAAAGALICGVASMTCYQLFYGLNAIGQWLLRDAVVKIVLVALLVALGGGQSVERAAGAFFLSELALLLLGLWWARAYLVVSPRADDTRLLWSEVRFGLIFFGANLLLMLVARGGELAVLLLSRDTSEVAFFSLANSVATAISAIVGQLTVMITPSLTLLHIGGQPKVMVEWLGRFLKYVTIATFAVLVCVYAGAEWGVKALAGDQYATAAANLRVLGIGLIPAAVIRVALSVAVARSEPRRSLLVAGGAVVAFIVAAVTLVPSAGSYGASLAVVTGLWCGAGLAYGVFGLGPVFAEARFGWVSVLGGIALAVSSMQWRPPFVMVTLGAVVYVALLFASRVVTAGELRRMLQAPAA